MFIKEIDELEKDYKEKIDTITEVIYLIIKDICKEEQLNISDIKELSSGSYSVVIQIKDKIIKIGGKRETPKFPNNPYIIAPLLRKEFKINEENSIFVEVTERGDTKSTVTDEELYQLYKNVRELGMIWLDVAKRNFEKIFQDVPVSYRKDLKVTDEVLGLEKYRGAKLILQKGNIVICDNDIIYHKNLKEEKYSNNILQQQFEKRYQEEKMLDYIDQNAMNEEEKEDMNEIRRRKKL